MRTKGAHTRLASSSIDDNLLDASRQRTPLLGAPAALLCVCVTAAASLVSSHLEECHIYIVIYGFSGKVMDF